MTPTAPLDLARDGASPAAVEAAVVDGLGVQPTRIEVEPSDADEPPAPGAATPLTLAYERRMLAKAMVEHRQMIVEQIERLSRRDIDPETDPKTDA